MLKIYFHLFPLVPKIDLNILEVVEVAGNSFFSSSSILLY